MRIGILKCGQSPEILRGDLGDYDSMFERLLAGRGFDFSSYHVEEMEFPRDIHAADGWLLTGRPEHITLRQLHQLFVLPPLPQRLRSPTAQALRATLAPGEAALDISLAEFARRCAVAG